MSRRSVERLDKGFTKRRFNCLRGCWKSLSWVGVSNVFTVQPWGGFLHCVFCIVVRVRQKKEQRRIKIYKYLVI